MTQLEAITTKRTSVLLSHPVHQHAYEAAVAAQEAGQLHAFLTGFYRTGNGISSDNVLRLLPRGARARADALLGRRWHPQLDPRDVHLLGTWRFAVAKVAGRVPTISDRRMQDWAFDRFDHAAAKWLERAPIPTAIHGFEGSALRLLLAGRRLGIRTILDAPSAHEIFSRIELEAGADPRLTLRTTERVRAERAAADVILAPSDFVVDQLIMAGVNASRIVKIPYGGVVGPQRAKRLSNSFTALFVGRVCERKGVADLIDVWKRFDRHPSRLVVVGAITSEAAAWVHESAPGIDFRGHLSGADLAQAYADADVFVFPSRAEASARVVYEAMAEGLAVVTTIEAGSVVTNGVDGIVIEAQNREGLLLSLRHLFDQPAQAAQMGAAARATIEDKYTWANYRRKVAELYQDVSSQPLR